MQHVAFGPIGWDTQILQRLAKGFATALALDDVVQLFSILFLVGKVDLATLRRSLLPHGAQ